MHWEIFGFKKKEIKKKEKLCKENGITLIEIPYWWDFKKSSLIATIHSHRPDLISSRGDGEPIPNEPPKGIPKGISLMI